MRLLGGDGGGGQRSGKFSGGNARDRTNFGRRPVAFLEWTDYS